MKKRIISALAICGAIIASSCQKEPVQQFEPQNISTFTAVADGASTKTVLGKDGENVYSYWSGEEKIWIMNGQATTENDNTVYTWKKGYKADVAEKSLSATFYETDTETTLTGEAFYALYPASPAGSASWQGGENKVTNLWLTPEQTPVVDSYDPASHIAVAYTTEQTATLAFKNIVSYFKFTVASDNVSEVCIFGNKTENIAGNFSVNYNGGNPAVSDATKTYAKIVASNEHPITKGNTYYIAVLPTEFTEGFTVEVKIGSKKYQKKTQKSYILVRNKIVNLGTVEAFLPAEKSWSLVGDFNNWEEGAKPMTLNDEKTWYIAKNVTITNSYKFKFKSGDTWLGGTSSIATGTEYTIGGDSNISVAESGIYDVYLSRDETTYKVEKVGNVPTQTVNTLYLNTGGSSLWNQGGAWFAAYFFESSTSEPTWIKMDKTQETDVWKCDIPIGGYVNVIFCRMDKDKADLSWDSKWNQTADLTIPDDGNDCFIITGWGSDKSVGDWSKYSK